MNQILNPAAFVWRTCGVSLFTLSMLNAIFMLAPTVFMLEVYGRAVTSRSDSTLLYLSVAVIVVYIAWGFFDWLRSKLLFDVANLFKGYYEAQHLRAHFSASYWDDSTGPGLLADSRLLGTALNSPLLINLIDLPFTILFFIIIYYLNPLLGLTVLVFGVTIIGLASFAGARSTPHLNKAGQLLRLATHRFQEVMRAGRFVTSSGMEKSLALDWLKQHNAHIKSQAEASDIAGGASAVSKFLQTFSGSLLLGLGCWLTLVGELGQDGSAMIFASVLGARALMPMAAITTGAKQISEWKIAYQRVIVTVGKLPAETPKMSLGKPIGRLVFENVAFQFQPKQAPVLQGIAGAIEPGGLVAVLGRSGSGKSTLLRLASGFLRPLSGVVRLDGADVQQWLDNGLGEHLGHVPQAPEPLPLGIGAYIGRGEMLTLDALESALDSVGIKGLTHQLPYGVETPTDWCFNHFSGGQVNRLALARAIHNNPYVLLLDEPDAALDKAGMQALTHILTKRKQMGLITIMVTHRQELLTLTTKLLVLDEGRLRAFGGTAEVVERLKAAVQKRPAEQGRSA